MRSAVEFVISLYLLSCVLLVVFNLLYIAHSLLAARRSDRIIQSWKRKARERGATFTLDDAEVRELKRIDRLASFHAALVDLELDGRELDSFFCRNARPIQELALAYGKKAPMERAFMAYFIASFHCPNASNGAVLAEIMLRYLDDSTVFCRENVLKALYSLGNSRALEHAFDILGERDWYHSPKLLSDGMANFTGDKEELAQRLWRNRDRWQEPLNEAVVLFASSLDSDCMNGPFLHALALESVAPQVRFALVRYFQRHPDEHALPLLIGHLEADDELAIAAAAALASYRGDNVKEALKRSLRSGNWHIRHNAAQSLAKIGLSPDDMREIEMSGDRYALEMLEFVIDHENGGSSSGKGGR